MEFVDYREVLPALREQGLEEAVDSDGLSRLELDPSPRFRTLHIKDPASRTEPYAEAQVIDLEKSVLPSLICNLLGRLHLHEVLVIPVASWRDIIDCVAYDMAADEAWMEMDAVSTVHQNTRNPLAITRAECKVLEDLIRSLFERADSPRLDITVTSDVVPILLEVFYDGAISITCEVGIADQVERMARA